jgi:putative transcriptional regulator
MTSETPAGEAPLHHPPEALLLDYASGASTDAEALVIGSHLAACLACRATVDLATAVGGVLLDRIEPARLPPDLLNRTLALIDALPPEPPESTPAAPPRGTVPAALRAVIGDDLGAISWRRLAAGFAEYRLPVAGAGRERLRLLKAPAGRGILRHGHVGAEWTLVLQGSFTDETGRYAKGDFALMESGDVHTLVVGADGECVCLILSYAPVRYTGLIGKLLGLIIGR